LSQFIEIAIPAANLGRAWRCDYRYVDARDDDYRKRRFFSFLAPFHTDRCRASIARGYAVVLQPKPQDQWVRCPGVLRHAGGPRRRVAPVSSLTGQKYSLVIEKLGVDAPVGVFG
jgi:hypothetical protein